MEYRDKVCLFKTIAKNIFKFILKKFYDFKKNSYKPE